MTDCLAAPTFSCGAAEEITDMDLPPVPADMEFTVPTGMLLTVPTDMEFAVPTGMLLMLLAVPPICTELRVPMAIDGVGLSTLEAAVPMGMDMDGKPDTTVSVRPP